MFRTFVSLMGILLAISAFAEPSTDEIISRALGQDQRMREYRSTLAYSIQVEEKKLDRTDKEFGSKVGTATILPGGQISYTILIDLSDAPPQSSDSEKKVKESQKYMAIMDFRKLAPKFILSQIGHETVDGRDCYVLTFTPKGNQKAENMEERVINQLTGKFWVDSTSYSVVKAEGKLTKPVSVAWFLATMRELSFTYTTVKLPDGDLGPGDFTLLYDIQSLLRYNRRKEISKMSGYQLLTPEQLKQALASTPAPTSTEESSSTNKSSSLNSRGDR